MNSSTYESGVQQRGGLSWWHKDGTHQHLCGISSQAVGCDHQEDEGKQRIGPRIELWPLGGDNEEPANETKKG